MYGVVGTIEAAEGRGDELAGHLTTASADMEALDDCHLYLVSRLPDAPDVVHVVEVWTDADAHRASLELAATQQLIAAARPIMVGMGERTELDPVASAVLPS